MRWETRLPRLFGAWPNVHGARPFLTTLHLKLDGFSFFQSIEIELLETAAVKKNLLPVR